MLPGSSRIRVPAPTTACTAVTNVSSLTETNRRFNHKMSSIRARGEHVFRVVKRPFAYLQATSQLPGIVRIPQSPVRRHTSPSALNFCQALARSSESTSRKSDKRFDLTMV